jgi:hypothetical protein
VREDSPTSGCKHPNRTGYGPAGSQSMKAPASVPTRETSYTRPQGLRRSFSRSPLIRRPSGRRRRLGPFVRKTRLRLSRFECGPPLFFSMLAVTNLVYVQIPTDPLRLLVGTVLSSPASSSRFPLILRRRLSAGAGRSGACSWEPASLEGLIPFALIPVAQVVWGTAPTFERRRRCLDHRRSAGPGCSAGDRGLETGRA